MKICGAHKCRLLVLCWLIAISGQLAVADQSENISIQETLFQSKETPLRYYPDAFWLGVVEGLTEFMPVSSTAHLILVADHFGLNDETPMVRGDGSPFWYREPGEGREGIAMTRKHAVDTYNIVLQGGTILAVIFLYWGTILYLLRGSLRREAKAFRMIRNLLLAFIPIVPMGLFVEPMINKLFQVDVSMWGLLTGTLAIVVVELWRRGRVRQQSKVQTSEGQTKFGERSWNELSAVQSLAVGLIQAAALFPGFSRALSVILGGYLVGLRPSQAAEFSFLVGLPTIMGAALLKGYKDGALMLEVIPFPPLLFGLLVSAVTAALAVSWLRNHINKWGLWIFVVYRSLLVGAIYLCM
jgi:undecaprenyl-diphosphatase